MWKENGQILKNKALSCGSRWVKQFPQNYKEIQNGAARHCPWRWINLLTCLINLLTWPKLITDMSEPVNNSVTMNILHPLPYITCNKSDTTHTRITSNSAS